MTKKLTLILITIVVSIIVLVIFQTDPGINVEMVTAEDGFLDLGDWAIDEAPSLNVSGNWEVYSDVLLDPNQFTDRSFFLLMLMAVPSQA